MNQVELRAARHGSCKVRNLSLESVKRAEEVSPKRSEFQVSPVIGSISDRGLLNRLIGILLSLLVLAYGCWLAISQIFQGFRHWDDEGYMIISLLHYVKHGGLYTTTFSEYGPFYFLFQRALHVALHLPISHDGGRILTLIYWISSSTLAGFVAYKMTRHTVLSALAFFATVLLAIVLKNEPGHPDDLVLFFTDIGLVLAVFVRSGNRKAVLLLLGAVGGFLALIKINVGIFFLAAVYFACISVMARGRLRSILFAVGAVPALFMPMLLMHLYLNVWAKHYCELATAAIALLLWTSWRVKIGDHLHFTDLLFVAGGTLAAVVLILGIALAQGTSPSSLLDGIILLPLRHPAALYVPLYISARGMILAGTLLLLIILIWHFKRKLQISPDFLGLVRMVIGMEVILTLTLFIRLKIALLVTLFLLPLLYLRAAGEDHDFARSRLTDLFPRLMLSAMIAFQFLQAYPVAGDELPIAFAPAAVWGCVLISDGSADLMRKTKMSLGRMAGWLKNTAFINVLTLCFTILVMFEAHIHVASQKTSVALNFPGATMIRVSEQDAQTYRRLVSEIRNNCDVLFTLPGMSSLNLWAGVPTPNGHNVGPWMTIFTKDEQTEIVLILRQHAHPCIVYNSRVLRFWMPAGPGPLKESPIAEYMWSETQPITTVSDYVLRTRKPRVNVRSLPEIRRAPLT